MCQQITTKQISFIVFTLIFQTTLSYENKDVRQIKVKPSLNDLSSVLNLGHNLGLRTVSSLLDLTSNTSNTQSPAKKWQEGRVSRKQYEIVNMLWRKSKESEDVDIGYFNFYTTDPILKTHSRIKQPSTTPSSIEFYYLDNEKHQKHQLVTNNNQSQDVFDNPDKITRTTKRYPNFALGIINPKYVRRASQQAYTMEIATPKTPNFLTKLSKNLTGKKIPSGIFFQIIKSTIANDFQPNMRSDNEGSNDEETCPVTETFITLDMRTRDLQNEQSESNFSKLTTMYDKIKFFEMYDKNTPLPNYGKVEKAIDLYDVENSINGNKLSNELKVLPLKINNGTHKPKHSKKHIVKNNIGNSLSKENNNLNTSRPLNLTMKMKNIRCRSLLQVQLAPNLTEFHINSVSTVVNWTEYSFMAAYIYEPSQVYCDAAGISPYWLVTSGSCLSRRHNNPRLEGRSAFVAFCGSSWWSPDRVAYVKYSVVHPSYRQRDKQRRYMYNIGLVQVVVSMATCPGWAPVPVISHQFADNSEGTKGYAVGWGLDRYDTRYTANDLPKYPLMTFESKVFAKSCPENIQVTDTKYEKGIKNLCCLLLPPYAGEQTDPIHGGMLILEGKLAAIYLQERRRPTGDQSAHYTGIWRLVPWVNEMVGEPDEPEALNFGK